VRERLEQRLTILREQHAQLTRHAAETQANLLRHEGAIAEFAALLGAGAEGQAEAPAEGATPARAVKE
jgi:hypothetical protein